VTGQSTSSGGDSCTYKPVSDRIGGDIVNLSGIQSPEACCAVCVAASGPECRAFSYDAANSICYIKSVITDLGPGTGSSGVRNGAVNNLGG